MRDSFQLPAVRRVSILFFSHFSFGFLFFLLISFMFLCSLQQLLKLSVNLMFKPMLNFMSPHPRFAALRIQMLRQLQQLKLPITSALELNQNTSLKLRKIGDRHSKNITIKQNLTKFFHTCYTTITNVD
jgi:hypothetical protein